ncbi:Uncharacterized protein OS=Sorangium cellulosum (strain So ce56) GN=sce5710 PE=4 SV=1 [Gemmata massiliana]|uniref:Uncharacterized protein n=1 Tax=Gemmata massiliana TaxID=1210884 RepID=A0A6P2CXP9_9BACT|nr:hypothetical protein [Gemmata massiliana]VTR93307.1 Uncharacterized protein OS=Sorangium cellulosum (strain So ce56) GN=sce5710 PE=4 SV=1 [Gemmata massiliana]
MSEPRKQRLAYSWPHRLHRLFVCAMCRHVLPLIDSPELAGVLETAEAFADGTASVEDMARARAVFLSATGSFEGDARIAALAAQIYWATEVGTAHTWGELTLGIIDPQAAPTVGEAIFANLDLLLSEGVASLPELDYASLFDDIERRAVPFSPSWRTSTAVALASQMYEAREFGALPILGDALQDAGCDSADVLNHCRAPGVHVRGCWVVDLVLGKE